MHLEGDARRPALAVVVFQCERVLEWLFREAGRIA
ncbi:hypothetical protein SCE1572_28000 [Sorangium cellulosum So0157-2]|uniref:Uncharacterized protein n=1 Tax=Sorangium cellulosum So0157-2 TaxID=1254432 RepID=S4XZT9_SORCE|nr:hypothetical protein SCE1572_28000 [Sorangium cellulosum So0157-2]